MTQMNRQGHTDSDGSSQLNHKACMIWTRRPIHPTFWPQWRQKTLQEMDMTTIIAPTDRSHVTRRPSQHHPWTWVLSMVWKLRIPQPTTKLSFRRTSQDAYTGPLPRMKPSIRKANPEESICCPVHSRHHLARWKGSGSSECPFQKERECRSTSARPADRWYLQKRTFQDHQLRTRSLKTLKLYWWN